MDLLELKNMTLEQLRVARRSLIRPEYRIELSKSDEQKKKESKRLLSEIDTAYTKLRNAGLSEIRDKFTENETDLRKGIDSVGAVLSDLKKVETILSVLGSFLGIVKKVLPML